ncbi:MAG: EF-P lysine aminoacylase EpmA [Patescibacteria group bacterium]
MTQYTPKINTLRKRAQIIQSIRWFFIQQDFLEVDTPLFLANPDPEPSILLFETTWQLGELEKVGYLAPSPEFQMKKLLAAGSGPIFQICKSFRNCEPVTRLHNPEFTIMEWYRPEADYRGLMVDCEKLVLEAWQAVDSKHGKKLRYQDLTLDMSTPWERLSVLEAFERYAGITEDEFFDVKKLRARAEEKGYRITDTTSYDDIFYQIMLNEVEPELGKTRPTFLYDYPASQAALARLKPDDPRLAERFELYIGNLEIANAFSELTDADEQEKRLKAQLKARKAEGLPAWDVDEQFISALKKGLPPTAGIALGIDRLVMVLTDSGKMSEVVSYTGEEIFEISI